MRSHHLSEVVPHFKCKKKKTFKGQYDVYKAVREVLRIPIALAAFHAWPWQPYLTTDCQREFPDSRVYNDGFFSGNTENPGWFCQMMYTMKIRQACRSH